MSALIIDDSIDIASLDSKIVADLCAGKFYVDVTPTTYIGNAPAYIIGAKVQIENPSSVIVKPYGNTQEITAPEMAEVVQFSIPTQAGNFQYGTYKVSVKMTDSENKEYVLAKTVSICAPDAKNKTKKTGTLSARLDGICKDGKLFVIVDTPPNYNGNTVTGRVQSFELLFPTVSQVAPLTTTMDSFTVQLYEGEYILSGEICAEYDYGDNVSAKVKYTVKRKKELRCIVDECCVLAKLQDLHVSIGQSCTNDEKERLGAITVEALRLLKTAKLSVQCGEDGSEYISALEELLGCVCTCNCNEGAPILGNTPTSDFLIEGCGITKETTGNTTKYTINNYEYIVSVVPNGGILTVADATANECVKTQVISFNVNPLYAQMKGLANADSAAWAAIINKALDSIDASCMTASWSGKTFAERITIIKDAICAVATNLVDNGNGSFTFSRGGTPIVTISICELIWDGFDNEPAQSMNTVDQTYKFLVQNQSSPIECLLVSPPTGFAVSGNTRKSAFGNMEWFSTFNLANASAVSGETVLLYKDAAQDVTPKDGVNYFGVGQRLVTSMTAAAKYVGSLLNITVTGDTAFGGADSEIFTSGVIVQGNHALASNVKWHGGKFTGIAKSISLTGTSFFEEAFIAGRVNMVDNSTATKLTVISLAAEGDPSLGLAGVNLDGNTTGAFPQLSNSYVYSLNNRGVKGTTSLAGTGYSISNVIALSDGNVGLEVSLNDSHYDIRTQVAHCTGRSTAAEGVYIFQGVPIGTESGLTHSNAMCAISHINGFSASDAGIWLQGGNMKQSTGVSVSGSGIFCSGRGDFQLLSYLIECVGDSTAGAGLKCEDNVHIAGGTFISNLNTSGGNPIKLDAAVGGGSKFFIAGVKTIAFHASAYGVAGAGTLKIINSTFLNQNATHAAGIDPALTITASVDLNNGNRN